MIELHYWPTPNGRKVSIMLEECGLPYRMIPVDISLGQQKSAEFLEINPNGRIPAIVDLDPADKGGPLAVFESGAILQYLAEKTGRFRPSDARRRAEVDAWLMWQMGGLGPMAGQTTHFLNSAPERIPYAVDRFVKETSRLFGVLDTVLSRRDFIAGDYSIADMAVYPWAVPHARLGQTIGDFPSVQAWLSRMAQRPAVGRGFNLGQALRK